MECLSKKGMLSMKIINIAGLFAAAFAVAASGSPVSAADLGNPHGGSMKDDGYAAPVMRGPVGPCYVRGDLGYSWSRAPGSASWPVTTETQDFSNPAGNASGYTSTYAYAGNTITETSMGNSWFGGVGLGCGSGSR